MNITGPQYSKETKGIRSSKDIVDQQVKLVFVYPMIFDNYLSNYMNNFRDFISVNMLKEIFLSNTLNIITTASYIHPLIDEKGEKVEPQKNIQQIKFSDSGFSLSAPQQDVSREQSKYEITQRVEEKTAIIKQLLRVDPKLSAFRPYVNMITMSNNIDVPVILGTKAFTVDTQVLTFMFIVAVANRPGLKFSKKNDIDKMFKIIKSTDARGAYQLLNNLITTRELSVGERLTDFFRGLIGGRRRLQAKSQRPLPSRQGLARSIDPIETLPREDMLSYDESFEILKGTQSKISDAQTFFNFVYDPSMLKKKFGIDLTQGQVSGAITKVNADLQNVMNSFESNFIKTISIYGDSVITSLIYLLYPAGSNVDTLKLREKYLNSNLLSEISDFINNNISKTMENSLSKKSAELADQKLSELSSLCGDDFSDSDGMLEEISRNLKHIYLTSPSFDERALDNFLRELDKASRNASTQTARVTKSLNILLGSGTADTIIDKVHNIVNEFLNQIINELRSYDPDFNSTPAARFFTPGQSIDKLIDQAIFSIGKYLVFLFQYNFQIAICRYIKVVETEIKTAKNSVVDYPNYTLVVPVETIMAVATAFAAKKYEDLIERGENIGQISNIIKQINDRYILGVVRYFVNTLEIPNLMVVDKKDGKLYYKLMHQSDVQKINLRTVDTYVDNLTSTVLKN